MHKSRFSDSQILVMLKQNEDGAVVSDICREHSVSQDSSTSGDLSSVAWTHL